ncbi:hypothetical protein ACIGO9_21370 [Nocardia asteroides]|uniref:hypothetical protein n=1 Tax=Nocardia asteroides TaxID=1824 RepID=UPI0037C6BCA0
MTDDELVAKFRHNIDGVIARDDADAVVETLPGVGWERSFLGSFSTCSGFQNGHSFVT